MLIENQGKFLFQGKCYLMVEATSQLYRCIAPIQPWLYYLFEAYQGPEKILGVCFAALYGVSKRNDLLSRIKLFYMAVWNLFQNAVRFVFLLGTKMKLKMLTKRIHKIINIFTEFRRITVKGPNSSIWRYMCNLS